MKKINVAELLKGCPKGMELDCTMFENTQFINVEEDDKPICIRTEDIYRYLTKFGTWTFDENAKCVIFPKGRTSWEGFKRPFKDGDIITCTNSGCTFISIFKKKNKRNKTFVRYCALILDDNNLKVDISWSDFCNPRFATEEEKQKLFQAIKEHGYKWNTETKTLEKLIQPKFKVEDRIKHKTRISQGDIVTEIKDTHYILNDESALPFTFQDDYELVPDKFDINTLKPFDKVLARDKYRQVWIADFFSHIVMAQSGGYRFACIGHYWHQCVPYEGNQHLLGKTDDCDEYFKIWE